MKISRKDFIMKGVKGGASLFLAGMLNAPIIKCSDQGSDEVFEYEIIPVDYVPNEIYFSNQKPIVSISQINGKRSYAKGVEYSVTEAIDLIGGINNVTAGKERILLKPNLVNPSVTDTTKPQVIEELARLMKNAGKEVYIGEASAASIQNSGNVQSGICRTKNYRILQAIQNDIYNRLGYTYLSNRINVPLVNLHLGNMVKMNISDNFVFKEIYFHEDLYKADLVCSVPMMKTHGLAGVTLALKNVGIGGFPGLIYGTVRSQVHSNAAQVDPTGTSSTTVDMVKANKIGLNVIDATTAMQGQGPSTGDGGELIKMNLIIASTNALAADMVAASIMGFDPGEIDTFKWAWKAGMKPLTIGDIEIRGKTIESVKQKFKRADVIPYTMIQDYYGPPC